MTIVTIVDLGLGNMHSVARAVERAGGVPLVCDDIGSIENAARILVPGQGSFAAGAKAVSGELGQALLAYLQSGRPYLGICLGMQLLFEASDEAPDARGLGWFKGRVRRLQPGHGRKVPHMGWNQVRSTHAHVQDGGWFYFVHSYHCVPDDESIVAAQVDYGDSVCAAVAQDSVLACQFHPEKSQRRGEALLRCFLQSETRETTS